MFPFFNNYPGTDLHEIDLAYLLHLAADWEANSKFLLKWVSEHEIEYKDLLDKVNGLINSLIDVVVPWDSSVAYPIYSIVEYQGVNYIALQNVPVGVMITNTDYWQEANTVVEQINAIGVTVNDAKHEAGTPFDRPLNIVCVSDIHFSAQYIYHEPASMRAEFLVKTLLEEHAKNPIDCLCLLGDITTDDVAPAKYGREYLDVFYRLYANRLPFPVYAIGGNHDGYTNDAWKRITGTPREYMSVWNDYVFVFLNSFDIATDPNQGAGGAYHGNSPDLILKAIDDYPDKKIIVFSHYFVYNSDSAEFHAAVEDDHVLFLVMGHNHHYGVSTYGTKKLLTLGHFSYNLENGTVQDYDPDNPNSPWSYTVLNADPDGIKAEVIKPANRYYTADNFASYSDFAGANVDLGYMTDYTDYKSESDYYADLEPVFLKSKTPQDDYYTLNLDTAIPWGDDLNNYKTPGIYGTGNSSWTASLSNGPADTSLGGVKLIVERVSGSASERQSTTFYRQTMLTNARGHMIYTRSFNPNTNAWSTWERYISTQDISNRTIAAFKTNSAGSAWIDAINNDNTLTYRLFIDINTGRLTYQKNDHGTWSTIAVLAQP